MRKPADIDAQIKALQDKARSLKERQKSQLGELVLATGADALPLDALAGVLLFAVEQVRETPEAVARWTERGQAFFRGGGKPDPVGSVTGPVTLLRKLQATARLLKRAAIQRHKLDAQKTRTDMRDWAKARRERHAPPLIELGGLVTKSRPGRDGGRRSRHPARRLHGTGRPAARIKRRRRSAPSRHALAPSRPPGLRCRSECKRPKRHGRRWRRHSSVRRQRGDPAGSALKWCVSLCC